MYFSLLLKLALYFSVEAGLLFDNQCQCCQWGGINNSTGIREIPLECKKLDDGAEHVLHIDCLEGLIL